jgi:hypothetical protein
VCFFRHDKEAHLQLILSCSKNLQKGFFDRNVNFREIFTPISHNKLKLVRAAEMLDDASAATLTGSKSLNQARSCSRWLN